MVFKKIISSILALAMVAVMSTSVLATSNTNLNNEHLGDTITYESQNYIVYQENEDGTVYAASESITSTYAAACAHQALELYPGSYPYPETRTPNPKTPNYCYEERTIQNARCAKCQQPGFLMLGKWGTVPHDYPWFFGNECKKCNYKK